MTMDELAKINKERWEALVAADVAYARPFLDMNAAKARAWLAAQGVAPAGALDDLVGKDVLCLASGGGQQSVAFALLGARVTVFDLAENQLARDVAAAAHLGVAVTAVQGDMRDLSRFADDSFDLVWQPYSLNFVDDARAVLAGVARLLRPGGFYRLQFANPFVVELDETLWDGRGYPLKLPYVDGAELAVENPDWVVRQADGTERVMTGPREFRHTLSAVVNTLIAQGFVLLGLWEDSEDTAPDPQAEPGTWAHFVAVAPPYLRLWAVLNK